MSDNGPSKEMSSAEIDVFLAQPLIARLATASNNRPQVTPLWFLWDGESLWMETHPDFKKARNLKQNPECQVVIDVNGGGLRIKGVVFEGRAELIHEPTKLVMDTVSSIYERYLGAEAFVTPTVKAMLDSRHVLIKLTPRKVMSWDWTHEGIASLL